MASAKPMLGDIELQLVQKIETDRDQVLARHEIPALEGDFLQRLNHRATRFTLTGVLTGPEAGDGLKTLRDKFRAAEPVPFVADISTATRVDQVLIEEMGVRELAGKPERFEYAFTLREYTPAEAVITEEPPEPETPDPPDDDIDDNVGTLIVEVIVEGQPDFDFDQVTVTVQGTTQEEASLSRTLTTHEGNIWAEENVPASQGEYTVTAVVTDPEAMSGSAPAAVQAGQTTRVRIVLQPGATIAKAFVTHYWFDKAFIEPCMRAVMREIAEYANTHPDKKLIIVGHTDLVGGPEYNQSLSERRARGAYAYLTFGRDQTAALEEWNQLRQPRPSGQLPSIHDSWSVREYQYMLQDLGYYNRNVDEDHGPATDDAVRNFQMAHGLEADGIVGDQTWLALIEAYLVQDALSLSASQFFPNCEGEILKWLGCGEQDAVKNTQDAWRPNRRTELLFVKENVVPCPLPEPDTFNLPASGSVGSGWCLGPGNPNERCCFVTRNNKQEGKWLIPPEAGTIVVQGSIKFEDGTPAANMQYILIAPDGEYMDGEQPSGPRRGRPIAGRTDGNGTFSYPNKPKGPGIYILEVVGPFIARLASEPSETAKGSIVCQRLGDSSSFEVIIFPAEQGDPRQKLRGIIHNHFGEALPHTDVEVRFNDGSIATATTNEQGRFIIDMNQPFRSAKIHYLIEGDLASEAVFFADFYIDVGSIETEEGVRRRLHNLGYLIKNDLAGALVTFQATHGLDTTGEADETTRAKLVAVHEGDDPLVPDLEVTERPFRPDELIQEGPPI